MSRARRDRWIWRAAVAAQAAGAALLLAGYLRPAVSVRGAGLSKEFRSSTYRLTTPAGTAVDLSLPDSGVYGAVILGLAFISCALLAGRAYAFAAVMATAVLTVAAIQTWQASIDVHEEEKRVMQFIADHTGQAWAGAIDMGQGWWMMLAGGAVMVLTGIAAARGGFAPEPQKQDADRKPKGEPAEPTPAPPLAPRPEAEEVPKARGWLILVAAIIPISLWILVTFLLFRSFG